MTSLVLAQCIAGNFNSNDDLVGAIHSCSAQQLLQRAEKEIEGDKGMRSPTNSHVEKRSTGAAAVVGDVLELGFIDKSPIRQWCAAAHRRRRCRSRREDVHR